MEQKRQSNNARRTGPAVEAMYGFLLWLVPTVEKFPRSHKFLLGDRIQSTALDVLERLIEATSTRGVAAWVMLSCDTGRVFGVIVGPAKG